MTMTSARRRRFNDENCENAVGTADAPRPSTRAPTPTKKRGRGRPRLSPPAASAAAEVAHVRGGSDVEATKMEEADAPPPSKRAAVATVAAPPVSWKPPPPRPHCRRSRRRRASQRRRGRPLREEGGENDDDVTTMETEEEEEGLPLSFEQQESLSEMIYGLSPELLPGIIRIIREGDIADLDDDDSVDMEIEQLDVRTQWRLWRYVHGDYGSDAEERAKDGMEVEVEGREAGGGRSQPRRARRARTRASEVTVTANPNDDAAGMPTAKAIESQRVHPPPPCRPASSERRDPDVGDRPLTFDDVHVPPSPYTDGITLPPLVPPEHFTAVSCGVLKINDDGSHVCAGKWALNNDDFRDGVTYRFNFGVDGGDAAEDARRMTSLERRRKEEGLTTTTTTLDKENRRSGRSTSRNATRSRMAAESTAEDSSGDKGNVDGKGDCCDDMALANYTTFPIDSTRYAGSFRLRNGSTVADRQIVLRYVMNSSGSYNVYGRGANDLGTFHLVGTMIPCGGSTGLLRLYRLHPYEG